MGLLDPLQGVWQPQHWDAVASFSSFHHSLLWLWCAAVAHDCTSSQYKWMKCWKQWLSNLCKFIKLVIWFPLTSQTTHLPSSFLTKEQVWCMIVPHGKMFVLICKCKSIAIKILFQFLLQWKDIFPFSQYECLYCKYVKQNKKKPKNLYTGPLMVVAGQICKYWTVAVHSFKTRVVYI